MGSTVAPKMFSQPGVFGTSDTSSVINKTNPVVGFQADSVPSASQSLTSATLGQLPNQVPDVNPSTNSAAFSAAMQAIRPRGFRGRGMFNNAFYGE